MHRGVTQNGLAVPGERYYSPQVTNGQMYSAFRLRTLKPKKKEREKNEQELLLQAQEGIPK